MRRNGILYMFACLLLVSEYFCRMMCEVEDEEKIVVYEVGREKVE